LASKKLENAGTPVSKKTERLEEMKAKIADLYKLENILKF
jgi:hypothetical protein